MVCLQQHTWKLSSCSKKKDTSPSGETDAALLKGLDFHMRVIASLRAQMALFCTLIPLFREMGVPSGSGEDASLGILAR